MTHEIFTFRREDGTFLCASIDAPRFCVAGSTLEEARAKATRALDFYERHKHTTKSVETKRTRVISPVYEREELYA